MHAPGGNHIDRDRKCGQVWEQQQQQQLTPVERRKNVKEPDEYRQKSAFPPLGVAAAVVPRRRVYVSAICHL